MRAYEWGPHYGNYWPYEKKNTPESQFLSLSLSFLLLFLFLFLLLILLLLLSFFLPLSFYKPGSRPSPGTLLDLHLGVSGLQNSEK
jgi:hypothetical protein